MVKYLIQQANNKKDVGRKRRYARKIAITSFLLILLVIISGVLFNIVLKENSNNKLEEYLENIQMTDETFEEEVETLDSFLEDFTLSNENKARVSNTISVMYGLKNKKYESIMYMCKAIYFYEKADQDLARVEMSINLSATLINTTSYDMAENILNKALDIDIPKEKKKVYHIYIYTNLAESMAQRGNYDSALEAIQLADAYLEQVDRESFEECIISLGISKALAYAGLGEMEKSKEVLDSLGDDFIVDSVPGIVNFAIPYYEVLSYIKLSEGDLKMAKEYFEGYIAFAEQCSYESMKLAYIDKFTACAQKYGFLDVPFIQKYEKNLLNMYRKELIRSNGESAKILLDSYNTTAENVSIQSAQRWTRVKVYGGSAFVFVIITVITIATLHIRKKSQHDFLTGAYNRVKLKSVYRALVRRKMGFYVIMFDIDNFKMCNDVYGHRFGDLVLERISKTVQSKLPKASMLFRYGGEEFVIICDLKSVEEVKELAELIRTSVEELIWENGSRITISIGVSYSAHVQDPIKAADECLYTSKKTGKNKVTYHFE